MKFKNKPSIFRKINRRLAESRIDANFVLLRIRAIVAFIFLNAKSEYILLYD